MSMLSSVLHSQYIDIDIDILVLLVLYTVSHQHVSFTSSLCTALQALDLDLLHSELHAIRFLQVLQVRHLRDAEAP